jgi:hypothetical protein
LETDTESGMRKSRGLDLHNEKEGRIALHNEKEVLPRYPHAGAGPAFAGLFLAIRILLNGSTSWSG